MATKYDYSIADDTLNGVADLPALTVEIEDSSISGTLSHINITNDDLKIWFDSDLSGPDQTTLTSVVAAHTGDPLPRETGQERTDTVSTTSTSFILIPGMTETLTDAGFYCIQFSGIAYSDKYTGTIKVKIFIDSVEVAHTYREKKGFDEGVIHTQMMYEVGEGDDPVIEVKYASTSPRTAEIKNRSLICFKVK